MGVNTENWIEGISGVGEKRERHFCCSSGPVIFHCRCQAVALAFHSDANPAAGGEMARELSSILELLSPLDSGRPWIFRELRMPPLMSRRGREREQAPGIGPGRRHMAAVGWTGDGRRIQRGIVEVVS